MVWHVAQLFMYFLFTASSFDLKCMYQFLQAIFRFCV